MTASPLERAARALCELAGNPADATMDGKPLWMDYLPEVWAVLCAVRVPSDPVVDAGEAELSAIISPGYDYAIHGRPSVGVWEAMINAILR